MSNQLTNKLLILNAILLGCILSLLLIMNLKVLTKSPGDEKTETIVPADEDYTQESFYQVQDSLEPFFEELTNDTIALPDDITQIMTVRLKSFNWNNEFQDSNLYFIEHKTIFAQQLPADFGPLRKWVIITFSNFGGHYYHAACGRISLFEFQKEDKNWRMTKNFIAFGNGSDWGTEPVGCELVKIGRNNKYATIIHTSYSGNAGHEKESKTIYMEVDGAFDAVFNFTIYETFYQTYDGVHRPYAYDEGYSEMRIIKSDKAYFDIVTKSEEADWQDKAFGVVSHYVFDGTEYVENPCWLYTDFPVIQEVE